MQLWIYQQWPDPLDYRNCFTGGAWTRGGWNPTSPASWEDAVQNELSYHEAVVAELLLRHPDRRPPRIVPVGLALLELKRAVERGEVPGVDAFLPAFFSQGGRDVHPTSFGAYFVAVTFYARLLGRDPRGQAATPGIDERAAASLQEIAGRAVSRYAACESRS